MLILEIIFPIILTKLVESISIKNLQYVYSGASKLVNLNEKLIIECPIKGTFYSWNFYQYQSDFRVLFDQDGKQLIIDSVLRDSSGIYECKAVTGFIIGKSNFTVKVIDPRSDQIQDFCSKLQTPKDLHKRICFYKEKSSKLNQYRVGDNAELDCTAVGTDLKYLWTFTKDDRMKSIIQIGTNISKIIIKSVSTENEGLYMCEVSNEYDEKMLRPFKVVLSDILPEPNIYIVGGRQDDIKGAAGNSLQMECEVKNNVPRIYSIKWGKRIKYTDAETNSKNVVSWDQYTYRLVPEADVKNTTYNENHIVSKYILSSLDSDHAGIYTCLAMDSRGRTVLKTFNLTLSSGNTAAEPNQKSYFFLLYIILPAILIFALICAIIYCCVKSSSKKSQNSLPMKKYSSPLQTNQNKEAATNYYYPVNNNRPPLPPPNESQASLVSPNTLTTYSSYGNYHVPPKSHPSCCSSNDV